MRNWLAHKLLPIILKWIKPQPRIEGILAVTIYELLAGLRADVDALKSAGSVDTSSFATHDEVGAVAARVTTLEGEVGTPPADAPAN